MSKYEGMRWVKCDFQVQTPEDAAHWADADTRLPEPRRPLIDQQPGPNGLPRPRIASEAPIQAIARSFLERCHELGLEMVGITDHNFSQQKEPRDWFLTHLVEQNKSVAKTLGRAPIAIFPGFEVDIGYHVLCCSRGQDRAACLACQHYPDKAGSRRRRTFRAGRASGTAQQRRNRQPQDLA